MTAREEFIAKVKDGGDDGLVEVAAWLYDLRESDPAECRRVMAEVYVKVGDYEKAAKILSKGTEEQPEQ